MIRSRFAAALVVFVTLAICLSPAAAVTVNLKRETRRCTKKRRKFKRRVTRAKRNHNYILSEDGFATEILVVAKRGVVMAGRNGVKPNHIMRIFTDICKALQMADGSNDREFFDTFKVQYARVPGMKKVWFPSYALVSYKMDGTSEVNMDIRVKNFRLGQVENALEDPTFCPDDVEKCNDGSYVSRDPENNCAFKECPEEKMFCTQEVKVCPDGSYVGKDPDNGCAFRPCKGEIDTGSSIHMDIQRGKWKAIFNGKPLDYKFVYQVDCFCMLDWVRPREVTVIGGEIKEVVFADDTDEVVPEEVFNDTPTIEKLMDELEGGSSVWENFDVTFDVMMGFPAKTVIDVDAMIPDSGRTVSIESVTMLNAECPTEMGNLPGSPCSAQEVGIKCAFGSETCCDKTYVSLRCDCEEVTPGGEGIWMCLNTDRCFFPDCN